MFVIRDAQIQALAQDVKRRFVDRMLAHLREHFPAVALTLDPPELRAHVEAALARAREYGLDNDADDCRFLSLAAALGWDFDTRPEYAWMRPLLVPSRGGAGMQALMAECLRCLDDGKPLEARP